jgi:MFS family permease
VIGSALGPLVGGLIVEALGYRGLFGVLAGVAGSATLLVLALVPETLSTVRYPLSAVRRERADVRV